MGPRGWGPKAGAPKGGERGSEPRKICFPEEWGSKGGRGAKISRFFSPSPATIFFLSSISLGVLVEFWWCLEPQGPSNVHVWSSRAVV